MDHANYPLSDAGVSCNMCDALLMFGRGDEGIQGGIGVARLRKRGLHRTGSHWPDLPHSLVGPFLLPKDRD